MNKFLAIIFITVTLYSPAIFGQHKSKNIKLFDGKTFKGLEGDTVSTWQIKNGILAGGSLNNTVPHNEFIATTKSYSNFVLKLKFKITGNEGFINAGVQFRSKRIVNPPFEMQGYQADLGEGFWASLYDESRRNKLLATADSNQIKRILKRNDWNDYEIRCDGSKIQLKLNGEITVDYTEDDPTIDRSGLIAFQVHGGGKVMACYKDIIITELPTAK